MKRQSETFNYQAEIFRGTVFTENLRFSPPPPTLPTPVLSLGVQWKSKAPAKRSNIFVQHGVCHANHSVRAKKANSVWPNIGRIELMLHLMHNIAEKPRSQGLSSLPSWERGCDVTSFWLVSFSCSRKPCWQWWLNNQTFVCNANCWVKMCDLDQTWKTM